MERKYFSLSIKNPNSIYEIYLSIKNLYLIYEIFIFKFYFKIEIKLNT